MYIESLTIGYRREMSRIIRFLRRFFRWERQLPLLVAMVFAAVIAYIPGNAGTIVDDLAEIIVPLGIAGGLLLLSRYVRRHDMDSAQLERIVKFGWSGVLVAAAINGWWLILYLLDELPIGALSNQMVTVWSLGIGTGVLVGTYTVRQQESEQRSGRQNPEQQVDHETARNVAHATNRKTVLAESTWTEHASSTPILDAIVEELAEIEGVEQFELDPLYEQIDPDVFTHLRMQDDTHWQLRFLTHDYEILISSHGTLTIYDTTRG